MTTRERQGIGQPNGYRMTVPVGPTFDPLVVTGVVLKVTRPGPDSTTVEEDWSAFLTDQTADAVTVVHLYEPTEPAWLGTWRLWAQFTAPGQDPGPRSEVDTMIVIAKDAPQ